MGAACCSNAEDSTSKSEVVSVEQAPSHETPPGPPLEVDEPQEEPPEKVPEEAEPPKKQEPSHEGPKEFTVVLGKSGPQDKVGAKVGRCAQGLEVLEVKTGLMQDHNRMFPNLVVQPGDFIVEGNGKRNSGGILEVIGSQDLLELKILRRPPIKEVPPKNEG